MNKVILASLLICFLISSACGGQPAPTQSSTALTETAIHDQDPCTPQNLPTTVQPINDLMREFDEASNVASNIPVAQLPNVISNLQRIRRETQDVQIPACLAELKTHEVNHMELMIQTLIAFVAGADQETLHNGLDMARKEHELYSLELVRLLGVTLAPMTATVPAPPGTLPASSTPYLKPRTSFLRDVNHPLKRNRYEIMCLQLPLV